MVAINREAAAVYLLDDDASILKATRRLLDSAGWNNVETFTDPIAFLQHAAMHRPELAVIDMLMPVMNGLEVQTRLRRVSPSTRVIVLTGQRRSVNPSNRDERRRFCFLHQRNGERRFSRRSEGCGRFRQLVSKADLRLNWGKSIERVTRITCKILDYRYEQFSATHVSAAKQQKVSSASDAPGETLPPKPYD